MKTMTSYAIITNSLMPDRKRKVRVVREIPQVTLAIKAMPPISMIHIQSSDYKTAKSTMSYLTLSKKWQFGQRKQADGTFKIYRK
jgi:hypothetical protein